MLNTLRSSTSRPWHPIFVTERQDSRLPAADIGESLWPDVLLLLLRLRLHVLACLRSTPIQRHLVVAACSSRAPICRIADGSSWAWHGDPAGSACTSVPAQHQHSPHHHCDFTTAVTAPSLPVVLLGH